MGDDSDIDFRLDLTGATLDGRYRVESVLGSGGMGTVYMARDERLDRKVVVKVPHPRFLAEEGFRERFERETRSLLQLEHPSVVKVLDVGSHRGVPYTVLQFLPGGSLEQRLRAAGRQSVDDVVLWLPAVAKALDFVHARGVVHRDVKPGNVLFDEQGHAFLADFGIAKALGGRETGLTQTGMTPGSPDYMAPESVRGADSSPEADQYALAAMVYEALAGRVPFRGATPVEVLILKQSAAVPPIGAPGVPPAATAAVLKGLERDPGRRFPSCASFAGAFADAVAAAAGTQRAVGRTTTAAQAHEAAVARVLRPSGAMTSMAKDLEPEKPLGKGTWFALLGVLVAALGVGAWLAFRRPAQRPTASGPVADAPRPPVVETPPRRDAPTPEGPPVEPTPPPTPSPTPPPTSPPAPAPVVVPAPPPVEPPPPRLPPPTLVLDLPASPPITASTKYGVRGRVTPATSRVSVAGKAAEVREDGSFSVEVPLDVEGENVLTVVAENEEGDARRDQVKVVRDRTPPRVVVTEPLPNAEVDGETVLVRGRVDDATPCVVLVAGVAATVEAGSFEARVAVAAEKPSVVVTARDAVGNAADALVVTLRRKAKSPFEGLVAKGKGAAGLEEYALEKDPTVVLVLVSAGSFAMGAVAGDGAAKEGEAPARTVTLGSYFVAKTETTIAQWGRFCVATKRPVPAAPAWATPEHPVTNVSWTDAKAYCVWAGVRLPSEAEWERAARARTEGALFAWGTDEAPPPKAANLFDETRRRKLKIEISRPHFEGYDDGFPYTSPVGTFAANGFGLEDVTGNVWEWCADGYEEDTSKLAATDPFVPADQRPNRVLRGGGFDSKPADCRLSRRNPQPPEFRNDATGFRVAREGPR